MQKNAYNVALYISFFPQLIAGPIVRYQTVARQITDSKRESLEKFSSGINRFIIGLAKKVIIADSMGIVNICAKCYGTTISLCLVGCYSIYSSNIL